jgi:hypothetical protein
MKTISNSGIGSFQVPDFASLMQHGQFSKKIHHQFDASAIGGIF